MRWVEEKEGRDLNKVFSASSRGVQLDVEGDNGVKGRSMFLSELIQS